MMMMLEFIADMGFWAWLVAGGLLIIIEVFIPGAVFMWLGIAALIVGGISFFIPTLDYRIELSIFAILSVVSVVIWRRFQKERPHETDQPGLNRRGERYLGRQFVLSEPISDGAGRVQLDDTSWRIEGPDLEAGARVEIMAVSGANFVVKQIEEDDS